MRLRREMKERIGVISGHSTRVTTRRIQMRRLLVQACSARLRMTRGRFEGADATLVSSSDEGVLSIALDHILCTSNCADDAPLEQKNAIAETTQ